jgi:hypothetical protein
MYQLTFAFALIKEPCQSRSSSSASGKFGLGGRLKYHFITNEKRTRAKVSLIEGDAAKVLTARVSSIFAAVKGSLLCYNLYLDENVLGRNGLRIRRCDYSELNYGMRVINFKNLTRTVG